VLSTSVTEKVSPPSVDSFILTFSQLIGASLVLVWFQVIVSVVPASHSILVVCEVTSNGSVSITSITISSIAKLPLVALLSLTVKVKFIVLATDGITSQSFSVLPATTVGKLGRYLYDDVVGEKDLNAGPAIFVDRGITIISLFVCSQQ